MKLYGMPNTRSIRVSWALEETDIDYQFHLINLRNGEGNSAEFRQVNPGGKIPVLDDDGFKLTESLAICNYIARKAPQKNLMPFDDIKQLALHDQWSVFAMCELETPLWTRSRHTFVYPETFRVPEILDTTQREFGEACAVLEKGLGSKPYILGDQFQMADILLVQCLIWAQAIDLPVSDLLTAYKTRATQRPAFQRALSKEGSL